MAIGKVDSHNGPSKLASSKFSRIHQMRKEGSANIWHNGKSKAIKERTSHFSQDGKRQIQEPKILVP